MNILFLGYGPDTVTLPSAIQLRHPEITFTRTADRIEDFSACDLVVSYGYRHILKRAQIETAKRPILNIHISYLPFNRGAHPLFWAKFDKTPLGVTIHEIDEGIDTGPICYQREVELPSSDATFRQGHARLVVEGEVLFLDNIDALLSGNYASTKQPGGGSFHRVADLPVGFSWDDAMYATVLRLKRSLEFIHDVDGAGVERVGAASGGETDAI